MRKLYLKKNNLLLLTCIALFQFSCNTNKTKELIGLWEIDYISTKQNKKLNLPWQGFKFNVDGSFVSWNTKQHFAGTWRYVEDTLQIKGEHLNWMDSKWLIDIYTHPDHYRKIINGKLIDKEDVALRFQLSKVHHLYVDEIKAEKISKPGADLMILGKWVSAKPQENTSSLTWLQFNKNNTFLIGKGEEAYGNYGVWLLNENKARIDLISFSTAYKDISWAFSVRSDTLEVNRNGSMLVFIKETISQ